MLATFRATMAAVEPVPADLFVDRYSPAIQRQANRLRTLVAATLPDATERVRLGWQVIGYDLPLGRRRTRYFAWVMVEAVHVHLGFVYGAWMRDPERVLEGAHLRLVKARFLTYLPGQPIPRRLVRAFLREAALVACMSPGERASRALDRGWAPEEPTS